MSPSTLRRGVVALAFGAAALTAPVTAAIPRLAIKLQRYAGTTCSGPVVETEFQAQDLCVPDGGSWTQWICAGGDPESYRYEDNECTNKMETIVDDMSGDGSECFETEDHSGATPVNDYSTKALCDQEVDKYEGRTMVYTAVDCADSSAWGVYPFDLTTDCTRKAVSKLNYAAGGSVSRELVDGKFIEKQYASNDCSGTVSLTSSWACNSCVALGTVPGMWVHISHPQCDGRSNSAVRSSSMLPAAVVGLLLAVLAAATVQ